MTSHDAIERYIKGKRLKPQTIETYRLTQKRMATSMPEWPTEVYQINEWLIQLLDKYEDTTVALTYKHCKAIANYLDKTFGIPNAFSKAQSPHVEPKERRAFTPEELTKLLQVGNTDERLLVAVIIDSAARLIEVSNIRAENVRTHSYRSWGKTSSEKKMRTFRLAPEICDILRTRHGFVWSTDGSHITASALGLRIRKLCLRAGITGKKLGAHSIRHAVGSMVAASTGSALIVKSILQHDKITTSEIYIHGVEDRLQQEVSPLTLLTGNDHAKQTLMLEQDNLNPSQQDDIQIIEGKLANEATHQVTYTEDDMLNELIPSVHIDKPLRSTITNDNLALIAKAFRFLAKFSNDVADRSACITLYKRMLRKVS